MKAVRATRNQTCAAICAALLVTLVCLRPGILASDAASQPETVADLIPDSATVDGVFVYVLPPCPADGWSAIPLPRLAESLLPARKDHGSTHGVAIRIAASKLTAPDSDEPAEPNGRWTRANGNSASELQFSQNQRLQTGPAAALLLITRARTSAARSGPAPGAEFRLQVITPDRNPACRLLLAHFGLTQEDVRPGMFGLQAPWSPRGPPLRSKALSAFLEKFDHLSSRGFVPTLRRGSTGIGYTLETELGIPENNSPTGDFLGMELKAHRGNNPETLSSKKMNLFLKEPVWIDGLTHRERIPEYGYVDDNGRVALYSAVTSRENSHGLALAVSSDRQQLELLVSGKPVATWSRTVLNARLQEKLAETAFVGAATRGRGRWESFHFQSVLYCEQPSVDALLQLVESRDVVVEMRMHLRGNGSARNHGTAFRIRLDQLPALFSRTVLIRRASTASTPGTDRKTGSRSDPRQEIRGGDRDHTAAIMPR